MAQIGQESSTMLTSASGGSSSSNTTTAQNTSNSSIIGSRNSAFQIYKPITILTNLQRGNVKTLNREVTSQPLTFHERAARGDLMPEEVNASDVNSLDGSGKTALLWASFHARLPTIQILLDRGAGPNFAGCRGETALMYAASQGHVAVINYLLEKGADVEASDMDGNTALIYATHGNHAQSITTLLTHGADLSAMNHHGDSAFNIAVARNLHAAQHAMENYLREFIERSCTKVSLLGPVAMMASN